MDAGFTCPNVDGTVAIGGCCFCDNRSFSPSRRLTGMAIGQQIAEGIRRIQTRYDCRHFLAYFQPATNTYAPVDTLRSLYGQALSHPQIVGIAIGTRADCVPDEVLDLLAQLQSQTHLSLELGLQSIHDRSLEWMNRGHDYGAFLDAVQRSRARGLEICAHVILGLPGESHDDMLATAREMARLRIHAVKIHNLYAVRNTPLAEQVARGEVRLIDREEYVETLIDVLEVLPPEMVVERVSGDAPPQFLVGPDWCADKQAVLASLQAALTRRDTWQGKHYGNPQ